MAATLPGPWKPDFVTMARVKNQEATETFKNYVTQVGFCLMLSKNQIEGLALARDFGQTHPIFSEKDPRYEQAKGAVVSRWITANVVTTFRGLERRGLVIWMPAVDPDGDGGWVEDSMMGHRVLELTPQGALVCQLLVLAGLIPEQIAAPKMRRKRKAS